jgi:DNA-binding protein YbaB
MDMEQLMAQAKELQDKVANAQDKLAHTKITGMASGGACIVEMTGKYDLISVKLREDIAGRSAGEISKIVMDAFRDAKAKADKTIDDVMGAATAGMPLPM